MRGDNKNAESNSCGTILEALQGLAKGDAPLIGKSVQLLDSQKALKNLNAMGAGDLMKINAPPDNEESDRKNEIAAEIERLKKEQKKAQIKIELYCLREHKAQGFVKDISEQESYTQKLVLKKTKKVRDPNMYLEKSQHALDKYIS